MTGRARTVVVASALAVLAGAVVGHARMPADLALPPCPTEDSVACHWDAAHQGNGLGRSFDVDAEGHVTYTP